MQWRIFSNSTVVYTKIGHMSKAMSLLGVMSKAMSLLGVIYHPFGKT